MCEKSKDLPATCALCGEGHPSNYKGCTVHKQLQKSKTTKIADQRRTKPSITDVTNSISNQPNNFAQDSSSSFQNSADSSQIQHNSHPRHEASQHHNNAPTTTHNEPINTQHTSYSQAVIGNKSNKSDFNNTNDHISNQKLTNQLTTFISEFKTLISPLITLLNPLITLLTSLMNKLSSNNGN